MKRLKVIFDKGALPQDKHRHSLLGMPSRLVDAETGEPIDCVQDFRVNVPMGDCITVTAEMLVSDIEVRG